MNKLTEWCKVSKALDDAQRKKSGCYSALSPEEKRALRGLSEEDVVAIASGELEIVVTDKRVKA